MQVLKQCGDELTRENIMKQAASLNDLALPMLLPGHQGQYQRRPTAYPMKQMQMARFDGERWVLFGNVREAKVHV